MPVPVPVPPARRLTLPTDARPARQVIGGDTKHSLAAAILPMLESHAQARAEPPPRVAITSIPEARETLLKLAVEYRRDLPPPQVKTLARRCAAWSAAFDAFRRSLAARALGPSERRALALLELHRRYLDINVAALDQHDREDPSMWDTWTDKFCEMVHFASEAAGLGPSSGDDADADADDDDDDGNAAAAAAAVAAKPQRAQCGHHQQHQRQRQHQQPRFYLEIGILPALFFLCAKCRDPAVRRRAIDIMKRSHIQEGIWNSAMAVKVAQRVMALEERGRRVQSSGDIAGESRVRRVAVNPDPDEASLNIGYELRRGWVQEMVDVD